MDISKFFESIEETLFQAATWAVMLPKTLIKTVCAPTETLEEISITLHRAGGDSEGSEFKTVLSPLVVWVLVVVLPYLAVLGYFFTVAEEFRHPVARNVGVQFLKQQSVLVRFAFVFGAVVAWPLTFSTAILFANRMFDFTRAQLKVEFYKQCLVNSLPVPFIIFPVVWFGDLTPVTPATHPVAWMGAVMSGVIGAIVFFGYQYVAVRGSLKQKQYSVVTVLVATFSSFLVSYLLSFLFLLVVNRLGEFVANK